MKFYPYKKGGGKSRHAEGGGGSTTSFEVVEIEVLAIVMGGRNKFPPFKEGGAQTVLPCLDWGGGGGRKNFQTCNFPIL